MIRKVGIRLASRIKQWFLASTASRLPRDGVPLRFARRSAVISFDVFDTVITRRWLTPSDLFIAVGRVLRERGLIVNVGEAWALERSRAEADARARADAEEISLEEIYDVLARHFEWTAPQRGEARDVELACEFASVQPIAETVRRIERLRQAGVRVAFISDTYLSAPVVRRLLARCGVDVEPDALFVSSEHRLTKHSGRLFAAMADRLGVEPDDIFHVGDNLWSDVGSARRQGVSAAYFKRQTPTRYEVALHRTPAYPRSMRSALAGSARAARLRGDHLDPHQLTVWETAANVAGPLLFGFTLWVLNEALARRISRLYFTARDGQILLRIAARIVDRLGLPLECRYLYGSRQAWHLPALTRVDGAALDWLLPKQERFTLREVFARIEVDPGSFAELLSVFGFPSATWDDPVRASQRAALRDILRRPELEAEILTRAATRREAVLGYFEQEGVLDGGPLALVDIGWHGRLQRSFARLLSAPDRGRAVDVTGFYLGLTGRPDAAEIGPYLCYLDAAADRISTRAIIPSLLEIFCAADHGSVRCFQRADDGRFEPVLNEATNSHASAWGLATQQKAIESFADLLLKEVAGSGYALGDWVDLIRDGSCRLLAMFGQNPSPQEAEAFGSFKHAAGQTHQCFTEIAPALPAHARWYAALAPRLMGYQGYWIEGSMKRLPAVAPFGRMALGLFALRRQIGARREAIRSSVASGSRSLARSDAAARPAP